MLLFIIGSLLSACASDASSNNPSGNAGNRPALTGAEALFVANGCIACHAIEAGEDREELGPSMIGVATRSVDTVESSSYTGGATTVTEYIRESIIEPQIFIVDGYEPLMPQTYVASLSEQDVNSLVNYLLTFE